MKYISLLFIMIILAACLSPSTDDSVLPLGEGQGMRETSTPPPTPDTSHLTPDTPIPTPTIHPQVIALQEQIAAGGETFTLNPDGQIEMQTEEGMTIVPDIQVHPDGTMTFTHEGQEFAVNAETLKINGQTFTFKTQDGKRWVFDGEKISEEIREFVPANTIEFTETLSNYDLKLAPDADLKGIYWDIAVSHLGDVISKSPGMEANRAIYEEIIKDHPEWEGIGNGSDYNVRLAFMKEFLTRSGGRMIVKNHNFEKFEADFNLPIGFEVKQVDELPKEYINMLALNRDSYSRGGGGRIYITENNQIIYSIAFVKGSLEHHQTYNLSFYNAWDWTVGGIASDLFRQTIAQIAFKDRDSILHRYELYTRGGVPKSGTFYMNTYWTFIK